MNEEITSSPSNKEETKKAPAVTWDDKKMVTTYANVVNMSSTREEVSLFFGTDQTWNFQEQESLTVELTNRIVLNPFAAKRLLILLNRIVGEYEKRYGPVQIDGETVIRDIPLFAVMPCRNPPQVR